VRTTADEAMGTAERRNATATVILVVVKAEKLVE
jgi:hypothetical protein